MSSSLIFLALLVLCTCFRYEKNIVHRQRLRVNKIPRKTFGRPFRNVGLRPQLERGRYIDRHAYPSFVHSLRNDDLVPTKIPSDPRPNNSVFSAIRNSVNKATKTNENKYPFIAEVIHSPDLYMPYICTAVCVDDAIFITAARCLYLAKVAMTTVVFQGGRLHPKAFVLSPRPTKDLFDDIGIIVVDNSTFTKQWIKVPIYVFKQYEAFPRHTDDVNYTFFSELGWLNGIAVGYVVNPDTDPNTEKHPLFEVPVVMSNFLCNYLYNIEAPSNDYFVPCYNTCDLAEYYQKNDKCYTYLAGEGHAVLFNHENTLKLMGIATWAGHYQSGIKEPPLPIGMAIPNTWMFYKVTMDCAKSIRALQTPDSGRDKFKYREACYTYEIGIGE